MIDDDLAELDMRIEKFTEGSVLRSFPNALLNEGDQIYVRKTGGRLQWIKANVHGGGESWQELTPVTAKHLENGGSLPETELSEDTIKALRKIGAEVNNYAAGWYQDPKGDLYQHDGSTWLGQVPTNEQRKNLEYLG